MPRRVKRIIAHNIGWIALGVSTVFFAISLVVIDAVNNNKTEEIAASAVQVADESCETVSINQQKLVEVVNFLTTPIVISDDTPEEARERIEKRNADNLAARSAIVPLIAPDLCADGLPPTTPPPGTTIPEGK